MNDPQNWLLPEENLIISLCHLSFSDEERSEVKDEGSGVKDWDRFTDLANRNGVIALCRQNITEADIEKLVPSGCLETLHSAYLRKPGTQHFPLQPACRGDLACKGRRNQGGSA